jgi:hypothetical protein
VGHDGVDALDVDSDELLRLKTPAALRKQKRTELLSLVEHLVQSGRLGDQTASGIDDLRVDLGQDECHPCAIGPGDSAGAGPRRLTVQAYRDCIARYELERACRPPAWLPTSVQRSPSEPKRLRFLLLRLHAVRLRLQAAMQCDEKKVKPSVGEFARYPARRS